MTLRQQQEHNLLARLTATHSRYHYSDESAIPAPLMDILKCMEYDYEAEFQSGGYITWEGRRWKVTICSAVAPAIDLTLDEA